MVVAVLLGLVILAATVGPREALVLRAAPPGLDHDADVLLAVPLDTGATFELRYTHSFNDFNVHELLRHEPGGGFVVHAQYVDGEGAGIAEIPGEATFVAAGDGWAVLDGIERSVPEPLLLRLGAVAGHRLVVDDREHHLLALAPGGSRISMSVEQLTFPIWLRAWWTQQRADRAVPRTATEQPGS